MPFSTSAAALGWQNFGASEANICKGGLPNRWMVGAARFELATSCAQGKRAARLRHAPTDSILTSMGKNGDSPPAPRVRLLVAKKDLSAALGTVPIFWSVELEGEVEEAAVTLDLEGERVVGLVGLDGLAEVVDAGDGHAVHRVDDVAGQ